MNLARWTIGLAVIALGSSPVLAQTAVQTAFNYELTSCCEEPSCCVDEPSCGCDEPSCCVDEPSCGCDDGCDSYCGDGCCSDPCGCGSTCGSGGCCLLGGGCNLGDPCSLKGLLDPCNECVIDFGLWTQIGYHSQQTPLSTAFGDVLAFNDVPDQLNLHQQWLYAEKVANGANGLDFGFRFDIMYGTDAQKTQAFGNDNARWDASAGFSNGEYGWALPQAYFEVAKGDFSVIAGHFFTLVGYEVVTAPDNFFYSHSLTMFNSEPFTHTGVLGTYSGFENVEFYAGWTLGWDTGFDQYTQNGTAGSSFLGGFSATLTDDVTFTYITTFGDFGARSDLDTYDGEMLNNPGQISDDSAYSHSMVFDVVLSDNLNYVLQSDLVSVRGGVGHDQIGINQYLFYTLNDCMALGGRFEWWKSDSQDFYEVTLGANYRPHANIVVRPEIRFDGTDGDYGDGRDEEVTFGIDTVFVY
ncbi:MAG: outer membrane beta-barrel protein [Planctomycetota bacterium]